MSRSKTMAALLRGVELAIGAVVAWLVQAYISAGDIALSAAWSTIRDNWDAAGGAGLVALLAGFGYTRSRLPNLSPVARPADPTDAS